MFFFFLFLFLFCFFNPFQWYSFEFVVVCIGKYGDIPKMPAFPRNKGPEIFQGQVLHSLDYSKLDQEGVTNLLKGKRVAVVGYKKSAIDVAAECAEANQGNKNYGLSFSDIQIR